MPSMLAEFKTWLKTQYGDKINLTLSGMAFHVQTPTNQTSQEDWIYDSLLQVQRYLPGNRPQADQCLRTWTHDIWYKKMKRLHERIGILNNPSLLNSIQNGTVTQPSLTLDKIKCEELEAIYLLFAVIKNYFLFIRFQYQLLPTDTTPERVLDEVDDILDQLRENKRKICLILADVKIKLIKYPEIYLKQLVDQYVNEINIDCMSLSRQLDIQLYERCVFRPCDAELLKKKIFELTPDFEKMADETNVGCFYNWCPWVMPPLRAANQALYKIKDIDIDDEEKTSVVLGIFTKVYCDNLEDDRFKAKMEACFESVFHINIDLILPKLKELAKEVWEDGEQYQKAPRGLSIQMRQMNRQGYQLLK